MNETEMICQIAANIRCLRLWIFDWMLSHTKRRRKKLNNVRSMSNKYAISSVTKLQWKPVLRIPFNRALAIIACNETN